MSLLVPLLASVLALGQPAPGGQEIWGRTDTQKEIEIGREAYEEVVHSGLRSRNEAYCRRVERVLAQLTSALPSQPYPFQAVVIAESQVNANCLPGGYVTVYEGLLAWMPDDDQLAIVLAHELGHGYRRHWARFARKMESAIAVQTIIGMITRRGINSQAIVTTALRYTREHEKEADEFGAELYLRAGFDPNKITAGMVSLRDYEKHVGGRTAPEYLSDHPNIASRIADVQATADKLLKAGLRPVATGATPDVSLESVFGKIPTVATKPCRWQPLQPGMHWSYQVKAGSSSSGYEIEDVGLAQVDGSAIARMKMSVAGHEIFYQLIADDDRLWRRNRPDDAKSEWTVETLFPDEGEVDSAGKWEFKNLGTETVETPAGKFENCLKIAERDSTGRILTAWFAPEVGLVRRLNEKAGVDEVLVSIKRP